VNIAIMGSSAFVKEMVEHKDKLERLGHKVSLHEHYIAQANGEMQDLINRMGHEHAKVKKEFDYIRLHYNDIEKNDAILVLNLDRKGIKNYIGANTFLEIGFAHVLGKKIFLLNKMPAMDYLKDEIEAIEPIALNGDLSKIK